MTYFYVLIETYWNVNGTKGYPQMQMASVLIETYWNVNVYAGKIRWNARKY